jgi:hypothetical protein
MSDSTKSKTKTSTATRTATEATTYGNKTVTLTSSPHAVINFGAPDPEKKPGAILAGRKKK